MQRIKCRDLLDLAINGDQVNNINFGYIYRIFSVLIKESNVGSHIIELPKEAKKYEEEMFEAVGARSDLDPGTSALITDTSKIIVQDLISDSFDASTVDENEIQENLKNRKRCKSPEKWSERTNSDSEIRKQKIENKIQKRRENRKVLKSVRNPSTVIADNFKIDQLAKQIRSLEDDLGKVFKVLDQLSMDTTESHIRIDDLADDVDGMVSWDDLNRITKIENDHENGNWKRRKLTDSEDDQELEVRSYEFLNLIDHHLNEMNRTTKLSKELDDKIDSFSTITNQEILSIRGELEIETSCDCNYAESSGYCVSPDICDLSSRDGHQKKSISAKQAIKISIDKMALIANHDGEIQNFKKFQSNITEQMEDIKVFMRDKPRNKPHDIRPQGGFRQHARIENKSNQKQPNVVRKISASRTFGGARNEQKFIKTNKQKIIVSPKSSTQVRFDKIDKNTAVQDGPRKSSSFIEWHQEQLKKAKKRIIQNLNNSHIKYLHDLDTNKK